MVPGEGVYAGGFAAASSPRIGGPGDRESGREGAGHIGPAAISIGTSPTFNNGIFAVEAHLIGLEGDLYGETVTIIFLERLRDQHSFSKADDLAGQIAMDVERSRELFSVRELGKIPLD